MSIVSEEQLASWRSVMKDEYHRARTQSLFWELRREDAGDRVERIPPLFTIKDRDHTVDGVTYPSLKKIYMSYDHIPGFEYEFAMDVFGSWEHWDRLINESAVRKYLKDWRMELEIKLKAKAMSQLIKASRENDPKGFQAAKYLADSGYRESGKKGRPSKEEVERERKIAAGVSETLAADMERLGLSVVTGGK